MKKFKYFTIMLVAIALVLSFTMQACDILDATAVLSQINIKNYKRKQCDHEFTTTFVEPTCTEDGYKKRVCDKCGYEEVLDNSYFPCNGHLFCDEIKVEPTCTEAGCVKKVCDICGYEEILSTISATGHEYAFEYSANANYHWKAVLCGHKDAEVQEAHDFGEGDVCSICGYHK